jgi:peptide/nickel transport system permease protein
VAVYVVRRLAWSAVLVIAVTLNAYVLFYVVPTEDVAVGASFANVSEDTGVNRFEVQGSVLTGYLRFLGRIAQGDLGQSWRTQESVTEIISRAAPATASLVLGGLVVWIAVALAIGVVSALRPRSLFDRAGMVFVLVGVSAQPLWLGYVLAYVFGYRLQWFPIAGYCDVIRPQDGVSCGGPVQWAYHLMLPWLAFALAFAAMYARMIRANLLEAMHEDYVRTARAKGLSEWATVRRHSFRNAVLPIVAMVGMDVGLAFAGSLFIERAFRIPGIGMLTITSLQRRDLPVILGIVIVVSLVIVVCNLIADLALGALDPRVGGRARRPRRVAQRAAPAPVAEHTRPAPVSSA